MRTLTPDGPRYRLWLGDFVEFTRDTFGLESEQMARVRDLLTSSPRSDPAAEEMSRVHHYLARLDRFEAIVNSFERALADPLPLLDDDGTESDSETP
jgi:hypothetical protein